MVTKQGVYPSVNQGINLDICSVKLLLDCIENREKPKFNNACNDAAVVVHCS